MEVVIKKAFENITKKKREKIIQISTEEFSNKGFKRTSLNKIINRSGISKGGMYKYINSKEDLYRFIVKLSIDKLVEKFKTFDYSHNDNIVNVLKKYAIWEFDFYSSNPTIYKLHNYLFVHSKEKIDIKIRDEHTGFTENFFQNLIMLSNNNIDNKIIQIFKWVISGINKDFYDKLQDFKNIESTKKEYLKILESYLKILEKLIHRRRD